MNNRIHGDFIGVNDEKENGNESLGISKVDATRMPALDKDAEWVKAYIKENGEEPSFF